MRFSFVALSLLILASPALAEDRKYNRQEDIIYGRKFGTALTLDIITPTKNANGAAVIWAVSGGWVSSHGAVNPVLYQELVDRGYTVFAVVHGSNPKFSVPECIEDMQRAVRFIRHNAKSYGIDPNRIGVSGGSAGGHLSLMLGTTGADANPEAKDPVDQESSRVQAVACFYPASDFLNFGKQGVQAIGDGPLSAYKAPFEFTELNPKTRSFELVTDPEKRREWGKKISPIYHVTEKSAPTYILHGDKDALVPIQQSEIIIERLKEAKVPCKLEVKKDAFHGWPGLDKDVKKFADWFDEYLKK